MAKAVARLTVVFGIVGSVGVALAQLPGEAGIDGFRTIPPYVMEQEKLEVPDIWVMPFEFRNPRYIMVDVPGEGRKLIWYMTYRVFNPSDKPRRLIPQFTMVTDKGKVFKDIVLPSAEQAVRLREDPTRPLFNSVTISKTPVPPTPKEGKPIIRDGVVFWEGIDMKNTKGFDIFVTGLSNGYHRATHPKTKEQTLLRKTLRLKFSKPGDELYPDPKEIRFVRDAWTYR